MSGFTPIRLHAALFAVVVVALVVISPVGAAMLSPALALVAVTWLGLFTGDRPVTWVRRVLRRRHRRRLAVAAVAPAAVVRTVPAGVTLAFALAMRPPPQRALSL